MGEGLEIIGPELGGEDEEGAYLSEPGRGGAAANFCACSAASADAAARRGKRGEPAARPRGRAHTAGRPEAARPRGRARGPEALCPPERRAASRFVLRAFVRAGKKAKRRKQAGYLLDEFKDLDTGEAPHKKTHSTGCGPDWIVGHVTPVLYIHMCYVTNGYVTDHHSGGQCSLLSVCRSPLCSTILKRANLRSSRGTGCQKLTLLTSLPHRAHCQRLGTAGWREAQLFPVSGNGLCGEGTVWSVCLWRPVPLLGRAGGGRGMSKTREKRFGILPDVRFTTMSDIRTAVVSLYVAGGRGPVAGPGGAPSAPTSAWRAGAAGRLGALGPAGVWVVELL